MSEVVPFEARRRLDRSRGRAASERVEVFPGVSLADLHRVWARCIAEIDAHASSSAGHCGRE